MSEGFVILNGVANFEICARCGQAIKHVYWFRGKPYGSECINHVTGQGVEYWVVNRGVIDEDATVERERKKAEYIAERKAKQDEIDRQRVIIADENKWLIDVLSGENGGFCESMAQSLTESRLCDFSQRQVAIMADIYSKNFGRRNSKAYDNAYQFFYDKFDEGDKESDD